jgi:hypothetical protein
MATIGKMFPGKYLKAEDIGNREVSVTIRKVVVETIKGKDGNEDKYVVYFDGKQKGLILNKTNATKIAAVAEEPDSKNWSGVDIVLYSTLVSFGSGEVQAIRVKAPNGNGSADTGVDANETDDGTEDAVVESDDIPF